MAALKGSSRLMASRTLLPLGGVWGEGRMSASRVSLTADAAGEARALSLKAEADAPFLGL